MLEELSAMQSGLEVIGKVSCTEGNMNLLHANILSELLLV